jgi:hypothetical protein
MKMPLPSHRLMLVGRRTDDNCTCALPWGLSSRCACRDEQQVWLVERLKAAEVAAELLTLDVAGHGFKGAEAEKGPETRAERFSSVPFSGFSWPHRRMTRRLAMRCPRTDPR